MLWYKKITKKAGHEDTLDGQLMRKVHTALVYEIKQLKVSAWHQGPKSILPRWRGTVRDKILMLPALDKIDRMSMYELNQLQVEVNAIKSMTDKYSQTRFEEILNADNT